MRSESCRCAERREGTLRREIHIEKQLSRILFRIIEKLATLPHQSVLATELHELAKRANGAQDYGELNVIESELADK